MSPSKHGGMFALRNMEQHPVPQNVTTFQFRLIGDMTIKQFGYLAGGAILGYIMYKLPLPFFFTWPLALVFAVGGIGFAFVPIEERPMDVWVLSFIKSVYSPTQFIWSKHVQEPQIANSAPVAVQQSVSPAPSTRKGDILNTIFLPAAPAGGPTPATRGTSAAQGPLTRSSKQGSAFDWFFSFLTPKPKTASPPAPPPTTGPLQAGQWSQVPARHMDFTPPPIVRPAKKVTPAPVNTQQKESVIEDKLKKISSELKDKNATASQATQLQTQLDQLLSEREKMVQELEALRKPAGAPIVEPVVVNTQSTTTTTTQTAASPTIQIIAPGRATKVGLPRLTTFPNIVTGIVKDKDKNLLPGVLVTVKDKDGVPLRALKTNRLGQFAASTQLPNGTYLVEIEDPRFRYTFDRAQITLNGSIVPALEIFAKTEQEITRAKLEKELFGKPNI